MMSNNLIVPIVLWGKWAPTHSISCIYLSRDHKNLVTGAYDGQICVWNLNSETFKLTPKCFMFGHTSAVKCIVAASNIQDNLIVTSSESGELCLWDLVDGRCRDVNKLPYIHTNIQPYQMFNCEDVRLFCNGQYPEILVIDPISLEILFSLTPKINSDWINAIYVLRPAKRKDDVVLGLTITGNIKVWTLVGDETKNSEPIYENESKQIRCMNALCMKCCDYNPRLLIIVCSKYWQIYDASNFSIICSVIAQRSERWVAGCFLAQDRVIVWSNKGKGYLYKLLSSKLKGRSSSLIPGNDDYRKSQLDTEIPFAYCILSEFEEKLLSCPPAMRFAEVHRQNQVFRYFLRGDPSGKIIIWTIPEVSDSQLDQIKEDSVVKPAYSKSSLITSLDDLWNNSVPKPVGLLDQIEKCQKDPLNKLTASVYLQEQGRLVVGLQSGLIIIVNASQIAVLQLLFDRNEKKKGVPKIQMLRGHKGRINCFLYPYSINKRYEKSHLVSGSVDFSVCLWDLNAGMLLNRFVIHAGEVLELMVPPENCTQRILKCICSVASDHSVSLINLSEQKCVFLAARHSYPITKIKWRPYEDFMLVSCKDGSLSIWQMETGHLDRVLHGIAAEEILITCEEVVNNQQILEMGLANPAVHFLRGLRHRNFSAIKHATQRGLQQLQQLNAAQQANSIVQQKEHSSALIVQGIKANNCDSEAHVFFFDIEAIIVELLSEEYSAMSPTTLEALGLITETEYRKIELLTKSSSPDAHKKFTDFLGKVKNKAEDMEKKFKDKDKHGLITRMKEGVEQFHAKAESILKYEQEFDKENTGTQSLTKGLSFMDLEPSRVMEITQIIMSLLHAWGVDVELDNACESNIGLLRPKFPVSFGIVSRSGFMSLFLPTWSMANIEETDPDLVKSLNFDNKDLTIKQDQMTELFSSRIHWELSTTLTTNHLLTMIALSNTLRSISNASFIPEQERNRKLHRQGTKTEDFHEAYCQEDAQVKQAWSLLSTMHCVLLPDKIQAIGSKAYKRPQVEILARRWQHQCIEIREATQSLLLAELNRLEPKGRKSLVEAWSQYLPCYTHNDAISQMYSSPSTSSINSASSRISSPRENSEYEYEEDEEDEEQIRKPCSLAELKRKQTTAIVLLGIIGAKFGEEFTTGSKESSISGSDSNRRRSSTYDGFALGNNLTRLTAIALAHLLLAPSSPKLPLFTPLRRAAIDLIGRGFNIWEPYLDVSKILLGLLELCCDFNKLVPTMNYGLPLTAQADSCRTAKNTLNLIASARPAVFITTMSREVARFNSIQLNNQSSNMNIGNSVLFKSKPEILHVVEMLIERFQNSIVNLLVEITEIILHCVESSHLKTKSLFEVFPAVNKFNQLSHCCSTRRIAVGSSNGNLVIYDLKQNKSQNIRAHSNAINAVSFSPEGKFLATYSCGENRLGFWQTSSGIFGIGATQTRCIRTNNTTPINDTTKYPPHKIGKLLWISNRTVVLLLCDGNETKFNI